MKIVEALDAYRSIIDDYIRVEFGGPMSVALGNIYDTRELPGFAAVDGDELLGAALYRMEGTECELAILFSLKQNQGVGTALLDTVIQMAKQAGCGRVWLITTNDNTHAVRFYQKYGLSLKKVHIGSMREARKLKSGIPERGAGGIPIEHELEFEVMLGWHEEDCPLKPKVK